MSDELKINNCGWTFRCPKSWKNLEETVNESVKYCGDCRKHVFLCQTDEEISYHANRLNCIALVSNAEDDEEEKWNVMGRYLPAEYQGATMKIVLAPTVSLDKDQIKFLVRSFSLGKPELNWREILCDGNAHTLKTKIPPDAAESLSQRMKDRNIDHKLEIES